MKPTKSCILTLFLLFAALAASAQADRKIEQQKRVIAALEQKIAAEEREISKLKEGRAATEERIRRLARQIDSRNQLLEETEKQARLLRGEIDRTDSVAGRPRQIAGPQPYPIRRNGARSLSQLPAQQLSDLYLLVARLRRHGPQAHQRCGKWRRCANANCSDIAALTRSRCAEEKELLDRRKRSLDSVTLKPESPETEARTRRPQRHAPASVQLSQKEKTALQRKISQEQQLDVAIGELRKLTKGNKEGDSFSTKTTGLRLPVTAGRVKRYKENMAEITGPKGAHVISIYDGKVVDVKRNRITNKYDVYVAHGEYITSYANMGSICVEKGQKVARNAQLGTIGSAVNIMTMETEYKLVFGIYPPNPGQKLRAENCFKK